MSINFYWLHDVPSKVRLATGEEIEVNLDLNHDPRVHIGKRFGTRSSGFGFTWAQDPETVRKRCAALPHLAMVRNEYDETFTGAEFLAVLERTTTHETEMVGQRFS